MHDVRSASQLPPTCRAETQSLSNASLEHFWTCMAAGTDDEDVCATATAWHICTCRAAREKCLPAAIMEVL